MRVLLLLPPMTQVNTAYPSTAYLTGFLRARGVEAFQADLAIELVLRLFSREGVRRISARLSSQRRLDHPSILHFQNESGRIADVVEPVVRFLQGKDPTLALRIAQGGFLPEGPRFAVLEEFRQLLDADESMDPIGWAFGSLGVQDRAKYLATLFVDDIADAIRHGIDRGFELSRYAERLAASAPSFEPIQLLLDSRESTLVDELLEELTVEALERNCPDVVGISLPFPGNVYGGFRVAKALKRLRPELPIVLGGGYVNTELRSLREPRVFDFVDFVTLDDGERPFLCILEHLSGKRPRERLLRTFVRAGSSVKLMSGATEPDFAQAELGTPTYDGLSVHSYLSVLEMLNPMHRIWSDGRWNKLTLAHGCYWRKCSFCDTSLDYIGRYEQTAAKTVVDRMESLIRETGNSGFHFVDEAAPPAVLRGVSEEILRRGLSPTWWGNIRFERTFAPELAELLARAGCVAVSGGLEVASDRLLRLMQKGVTVEQVARATRTLSESGILVHAYLMYGFPTQTEQETIDSLERVRQLFAAGCVQSAYWHRFSATAHSPIGKDPAKYGIRLLPEPKVSFARNDLKFEDPTGCDHEALGRGLERALYNYMLGVGLDEDVRVWFDRPVPAPEVPEDLIEKAIES